VEFSTDNRLQGVFVVCDTGGASGVGHLGDRAFTVAAPRVWNGQSSATTSLKSLPVFRQALKTKQNFSVGYSATDIKKTHCRLRDSDCDLEVHLIYVAFLKFLFDLIMGDALILICLYCNLDLGYQIYVLNAACSFSAICTFMLVMVKCNFVKILRDMF
jgi:hypothetical protein